MKCTAALVPTLLCSSHRPTTAPLLAVPPALRCTTPNTKGKGQRCCERGTARQRRRKPLFGSGSASLVPCRCRSAPTHPSPDSHAVQRFSLCSLRHTVRVIPAQDIAADQWSTDLTRVHESLHLVGLEVDQLLGLHAPVVPIKRGTVLVVSLR
jgi:hypothetical protein